MAKGRCAHSCPKKRYAKKKTIKQVPAEYRIALSNLGFIVVGF
jgi:hypothetical protein